MATHAKFARLVNYSCEFGKASHIFLKNGLWRMSASLASPRKWLGECRRVWRVLQNSLTNVGESGESSQQGLVNVGKSGEYSPSLLAKLGASAHDKIGRFYV